MTSLSAWFEDNIAQNPIYIHENGRVSKQRNIAHIAQLIWAWKMRAQMTQNGSNRPISTDVYT